MDEKAAFIPALGRNELTWAYDSAVALLTREVKWRGMLIATLDPQQGDVIVDIGCGTATLAIMIKRRCPHVRVIGIDPDPRVLAIARRKMIKAGVTLELIQGDAHRLADLVHHAHPNKVVSSLVFHHLSIAEKRSAFAAIFSALKSGGRLALADYGLQRTWLMRTLFRVVQHLDGFETTQPNADGLLPELLTEAGFDAVKESTIVPTPTGSISLYEARRS